MKHLKQYVIVLVVSTVILAGLFLFTNPERLPSAALFTIFIGLYVALASMAIVLGSLIRHRGKQLLAQRSRKTIWLFAAVPVFFLLLQSIGQLTARDVLLAFALTALGYAYVKRMSQTSAE